jgi:hypothetical protein
MIENIGKNSTLMAKVTFLEVWEPQRELKMELKKEKLHPLIPGMFLRSRSEEFCQLISY